ncbi:MAG: alpha-galactosidase [Steroidobacteraceae bacterium]
MKSRSTLCGYRLWPMAAFAVLVLSAVHAVLGAQPRAPDVQRPRQGSALLVAVDADGTYRVGLGGSSTPTLTSDVAAQVDGRWLHATDYPRCRAVRSAGSALLGPATVWVVTCSGLRAAPDLVYRLRAYTALPFADLTATVRNTSSRTVHVEAIRLVDAAGGEIAYLGAPAGSERVLSDSFSEDRPAMRIHSLAEARDGMQRAVGSQLIYNRTSRESLFLGALTSDRFLTILRLRVASEAGAPRITGYQVDSTGTTELEEENSLEHSAAADRITLSLPVASGGALSSETLALSVDHDYHRQLETYGALIRRLHHARVTAPPLMGWWSWTAYYFGLDAGAALTNAQWLAQHFERYGYTLFHIDEGYQYARGEYTTANATLFPHGLVPVEYAVRGLGLTPGIWTAPFEVSERSWVFQHHPDWLVKNAAGRPIHAGSVVDGKDALYILDTTNPGAQQYLRTTYRTLVRDWGIHYIKLDFMDDAAIEGYYYQPHTTAMQAQRIGLRIIRDAVGNDVYLDKDGSVMLNPVGYVDYGRISQDTGHSFQASRDAASGIAARYYMDRNFFVSDPDAFTVSTQRITDQTWHEGGEPLSLDEAEVSIALAAVSGGMLEIGDNLPSLEGSPDRIALIENRDLIDMVRLGEASVPEDLMSYADSDRQPSIFFLKESPRQSILTVFNWTEHATRHVISLASLGLSSAAAYRISDVLRPQRPAPFSRDALSFDLPAHSVRMLKIIDERQPASMPRFAIDCPAASLSGQTVTCVATAQGGQPVLVYRWDFGDGTSANGGRVMHTWTEPGTYRIGLEATALDGSKGARHADIRIKGHMSTVFAPSKIRRLHEPRS